MQFIATTLIEAPPERVFAFHELPDAVARLTPQWIRARVLAQPASLRPGTRTILDIRIAPFLWIRNEAVHTIYEPPFLFADRQERGPFRSGRTVTTSRRRARAHGSPTRSSSSRPSGFWAARSPHS
jgi:ligand-binding SRPBCC domain-containing protein